jgi:ABC-type polysaccharide/polyol phosphate transport system ATPase subunit
MSDEVMIRVDKVSKKYCRNLKRSLRYGLYDLADELLLKRKKEVKLRKQEFWALRNLSFELKRGESLGVIGVNGSGKTTLLKMLQGLIKPSKGSITVRGHVGALISLGAGFQPILTGRENIYINAAILGVSKQEVNRRLEQIIDFADIGDFIDAPVRTYSSGMKTRLGFAVATNLVEPDVLLIDEVLAAGDIAFRQKCYQRMNEIVSTGTTIILVSHSLRMVERLCQRTLLLHKGKVIALDSTPEVCEKYYALANEQAIPIEEKAAKESAPKPLGEHADKSLFEFSHVELLNAAGHPQAQFSMLETLIIRAHFTAHQPMDDLIAILKVQTVDGIYVSSFSSYKRNANNSWFGSGFVNCVIPEILLREGQYLLDVSFFESSRGVLFHAERAITLHVTPEREAYASAWAQKGLVYTPASWEFEQTATVETLESQSHYVS